MFLSALHPPWKAWYNEVIPPFTRPQDRRKAREEREAERERYFTICKIYQMSGITKHDLNWTLKLIFGAKFKAWFIKNYILYLKLAYNISDRLGKHHQGW